MAVMEQEGDGEVRKGGNTREREPSRGDADDEGGLLGVLFFILGDKRILKG